MEATWQPDRKDPLLWKKQQDFNTVIVASDQKWREVTAWRQWAESEEEEEVVLRERMLLLGDQENSRLMKKLCDSHWCKCQEAASMKRVASILEEDLYKLRDLVVWFRGRIGAEKKELRGQVMEQEEHFAKGQPSC